MIKQLLFTTQQVIRVKANGEVSYNKQISLLPLFTGEWHVHVFRCSESNTGSLFTENVYSSTDDVTVFSPSTFFILVHTTFGLDVEIQLTPVMQVYIKASVSNKGKLKGRF